jgi:aminoglycoside/choline kinase family phosphotransferase
MTAPREALKDAFLTQIGWASAERAHLAGDASARSYQRLTKERQTAVLMDSPPGTGDDVRDFVRIAGHLLSLGLSAPRILEADLSQGFLLLEDLGDALFTKAVESDPGLEPKLYDSAVDVLLAVQNSAPPRPVPDLSARDWAEAAGFAPAWYARAITGAAPDRAAFTALLADAMATYADRPRILILRDYHAGNLLWLPGRKGVAQVGVLDFQQAQLGQPGYDLVSLLQDARRDVPGAIEAAGIARFCRALGLAEAEFAPAYATLGTQRALRIIGIFARLCLSSAKPSYVTLIPRVWAQLQRNLAHPALRSLRAETLRLLPEPTPDNLQRIIARCGTAPSP